MSKAHEVLGKVIMAVVGTVASIAVVGLLLAFPIKWTWNATMSYLFAWPTITWGKAWCLMFVCNCLLKSTKSS